MNVFYHMIDYIVSRSKQPSQFNYTRQNNFWKIHTGKACADLQIGLADVEKYDVFGCELVEEF